MGLGNWPSAAFLDFDLDGFEVFGGGNGSIEGMFGFCGVGDLLSGLTGCLEGFFLLLRLNHRYI